MGKGSNTTTVAPPKEMQEYYKKIFTRAEKVSNTPYRPYTGELVAPMSALERQAAAGVTAAGNAYKPYFQQAQQYAKQAGQDVTPWSAEAMQKYMSPYNSQVTDATMKQLGELQGRQRQDVVGSAISQGAWGGDRSGVAQAEMARQQGMAAGQTLAGLNQGNYQQAMGAFNQQQGVELQNRQMEAGLGQQYGQLGVAAQNAALQGIQSQAQLGQSQRAQRQAGDQARMQMWSQRQQYPFTTTQYLANIGMGLGPAMGNQTTTPEPSLFSQIGGLALGGMSMFGGGMFGKKDGGRVGYGRGGAVAGFPMRRGYAAGGVPADPYAPIIVGEVGTPGDPQVPTIGGFAPAPAPAVVVPSPVPVQANMVDPYAMPLQIGHPGSPVVADPTMAPAIPGQPASLGNPPVQQVAAMPGQSVSLGNPLVGPAPAQMPPVVAGAPAQPLYNPLAGANTGQPFYDPLAGAEKSGIPAPGVDPTVTGSTPAAASNAGLFGIGRDKWQGLAALGFGMAAGDSPYFGVNAGKGGMAMLQTMQQQREADRLQRAQDLQEARDKATQTELHQYHQDTLAQQEAQRALEAQKLTMPEWKKTGTDAFGNDVMDWVYPGKTPDSAAKLSAAADADAEPGALFDKLPPILQTRVLGMVNGNEPIPRNTNTPLMKQLMLGADDYARAHGSTVGFDKTLWQTKNKARQSFTSGADSKVIQSGVRAANSVGILTDAIEKLPDAPIVGENVPFLSSVARDWNRLLHEGTETTEADAYKRFDLISNSMAEQINAYSRGSGGAEADIQRILKNLKTASSKHELLGLAAELGDVVNGGNEAMQQKWHTSQGVEADDFPIMTKQSQAALDKIKTAYEDSVKRVSEKGDDATPAAADAAGGEKKFTGPDVPADTPPIEGRNGKWFKSKGGKRDDPDNWIEVPPPAGAAPAAAPAAAAPPAVAPVVTAPPIAPVVAPAAPAAPVSAAQGRFGKPALDPFQ